MLTTGTQFVQYLLQTINFFMMWNLTKVEPFGLTLEE